MSSREGTHEVAFDQNENPFFFSDPYGTRPPPESVSHKAPVNVGASSELDSSEDEVIFCGRQAARNNVAEKARVRSPVAPSRVAVTVLEDDIQFITQPSTDEKATEPEFTAIRGFEDPKRLEDSYIGLSTKNRKANKRKEKGKKKQQQQQQKFAWNDESAVFSDYIRNVAQNENFAEWLSGDDVFEDMVGLSKKEKAKFRALSTLDTVGESSMQSSRVLDDDESDDDDSSADENEDTDDSLDDIISQIRRGASFTMLDKMSTDLLDSENFVDFDIIDMQQDGPLGKKKKKGGRRQLDFGLSDSDLELELETAFENDRKTKKQKKKEREQLRAEGLLGKKQTRFERRSKLRTASGIEGLKVEMKSFLQSQSESLDLPPMKKQHRRVIHELANALALKSQSRGKGNARFPVLYKTLHTPNFNGKHSVKLDKILAQPRFSLQQHTRMEPSKREPPPKNNRQRPNMAASYIDGEVVGGSAPEIGVENKGRAMLEKMGWSSGTALGALNNKGILQPVAHVVKNTRAGLG